MLVRPSHNAPRDHYDARILVVRRGVHLVAVLEGAGGELERDRGRCRGGGQEKEGEGFGHGESGTWAGNPAGEVSRDAPVVVG